MGFSSSLQGDSAHEALITRQDAELRLLENMKRCQSYTCKFTQKLHFLALIKDLLFSTSQVHHTEGKM